MGLVSELRRRNVFRVAIGYAIIAWVGTAAFGVVVVVNIALIFAAITGVI